MIATDDVCNAMNTNIIYIAMIAIVCIFNYRLQSLQYRWCLYALQQTMFAFIALDTSSVAIIAIHCMYYNCFYCCMCDGADNEDRDMFVLDR